MKLLAIDTATEACSAALLCDQDLSEEFEIAPRRHAELILPMVDRLLARAGLQLAGLDALAFGRGPGAFTGVRIAAGVAQGLAFAANLPVVPVSTLAALAAGHDGNATRLLCAIDARMGEVYWCPFAVDTAGKTVPTGSERVSAPGDIAVPGSGPCYGLGSGWERYPEILRECLGVAYAGHDSDRYPRARDIALLARTEYAAGRAVPAEQAVPVYLRDRVTG